MNTRRLQKQNNCAVYGSKEQEAKGLLGSMLGKIPILGTLLI